MELLKNHLKRSLDHLSPIGFLILATVLLGFWFKSQAFFYQTFAFTYDVGRDLLAVSSIIETLKIPLIGYTTGMPGIFYGPTWYYILTPAYLLSGGNPQGISLFMALTGVLTAILGFYLGLKVGSKILAYTFLLLISVSQVLTEISAQIWNPNLIPPLILIVIILIFRKATGKNSLFNYLLIGLTLGLIFDLEIVFGILFGLATLFYLFAFNKLYLNLRGMVLIFIGALIPQLPRIVFEFRHDFLMTKTLLSSFGNNSDGQLIRTIPDFGQTLGVFFNLFSYSLAFDYRVLGLFLLGGIIIIVSYFFNKLKDIERKFLIFILSVIFIFVIGLSFFNHDLESHYYIGIPLIYVLFLGFSLFVLNKYLKLKILLFAFILVAASLIVNQLKIIGTFQKSEWVGDASVYRNQIEVVEFIYKDAKGDKFNTATYTPPVYDYPYQYIFKWYGNKEFGYVPTIEKAELFYLILEPDPQIPQRRADWLTVREGDGRVISEKNFPSGITVQKRIH